MKTIIVILILSLNFYPQSEIEYVILPKAKVGIMFPGITSWYFTKDPDRRLGINKFYTIYPGYYLGIGIESNEVIRFENIGVYFGLDISYGKSSTGEVEIADAPAEFEISSLPIMFWTTIKSNGKIVPFIKCGIGTQQSGFKEFYRLSPFFNFELNDWFFSWGIGGGIDFNYFERIKINIFVEGIIMETGIQEKLPDGREIYYDSRNGSTYAGIQIGYSF